MTRASAKRSKTRYRKRKRALPDNFTKDDLAFALLYWDNKCPSCNLDITDNYQLDHHIPISGQSCPGTVPTNIIPLCVKCNRAKSNKSPELFYRNKLIVRKRIDQFFSLVRRLDQD